jgi:hypothetical protein
MFLAAVRPTRPSRLRHVPAIFIAIARGRRGKTTQACPSNWLSRPDSPHWAPFAILSLETLPLSRCRQSNHVMWFTQHETGRPTCTLQTSSFPRAAQSKLGRTTFLADRRSEIRAGPCAQAFQTARAISLGRGSAFHSALTFSRTTSRFFTLLEIFIFSVGCGFLRSGRYRGSKEFNDE